MPTVWMLEAVTLLERVKCIERDGVELEIQFPKAARSCLHVMRAVSAGIQ